MTEDPAQVAAVRTFLIADVRGYTAFTQAHGDEAAARLAHRFAELTREQVERAGGHPVELRGDEALCVFDAPRAALRCGVELQRRFADEMRADPSLPLRVGIGVDAGEAVAVEGGYRGGALNLAARLCSLAKPGELLISEGVVLLARRVEGVDYLDQGRVSLKGLREPVRYYRARFELDMPDAETAGRWSRWRIGAAAAVVLALVVMLAVVDEVRSSTRNGQPGAQRRRRPRSGRAVRRRGVAGRSPWGSGCRAGQHLGDRLGCRHAAGDRPGHRTGGGHTRLDAGPRPDRGGGGGRQGVGCQLGQPAAGGVRSRHRQGGSDDRRRQRCQRRRRRAERRLGGQQRGRHRPAGRSRYRSGLAADRSRRRPGRDRCRRRCRVGDRRRGWSAGADRPPERAGDARAGGSVADGGGGRLRLRVGGRHRCQHGRTVVLARPAGDLDLGAVAQRDHRRHGRCLGLQPGVGAGRADRPGRQPCLGPRLDLLPGCRDGRHHISGADMGDLAVVAPPPSRRRRAAGAVRWPRLDRSRQCLRAGLLAGAGEHQRRAGRVPQGGRRRRLRTRARSSRAAAGPRRGGRSYAFQLRPGLRYSDGQPVRASDLRYALQRSLSDPNGPAANYLGAVVGASGCIAHPRSCNLARGVTADDAAGTVTIHLTRPDPSLLDALGLPLADLVPPGSPTLSSNRPVPATGPYEIRSYRPGHSLVLVRNPHFRQWSAEAQPAGFPDEIRWYLDVPVARQLADVEAGKLDAALGNTLGPRAGVPPEPLLRRYPEQTHVYTRPELTAFFLNVSLLPFSNPLARQAVNYAVNRGAALRTVGGPVNGQTTCQILPPNIAGYRPACPFTTRPGATWVRPDIARAQQLVARSHTGGELVVVHASATLAAQARVLEAALRAIGYRSRLAVVPSTGDYFGSLYAPKSRIQAGPWNWVADYPVPADFLQLNLSCGSQLNVSHFCDSAIDREMSQAGELEATDPARANLLWERIDDKLTLLSPLVPLYNSRKTDFLAKGVGNYQANPQDGMLVDQLWVR